MKTGAVCIYFPITDPGDPNKFSVGLETADWVSKCETAGFAKYVSLLVMVVHTRDEEVY